jgi:hypothetical protein
MKNLFAYFVVGVALFVLAGCIGSSNSTLSTVAVTTPPTYPGNLSGQIFDATTGVPISGVGLSVVLVQGATIRTPDTLVTSSSDAATGTYGFANVPVELANINNFKLIVSKAGYQPFESEFSFGATIGTAKTTSGSSPFYNKIGNVYLFPIGVSSSPVVINVADTNGKTVAGVTVELLQDTSSNTSVVSKSGNVLTPTNGLSASVITAVTDATGTATFPASSIALGALYTPVALSTTANGFNLETTYGTSFNAGIANSQHQTISMANLSSLNLLEASRSFTVGTTPPLASGILNVIFNQVFTLDTTSTWKAALYVTPGGVASAVGAASATATATATVTGSSLVISPTITGMANLPASGVYITYTYPGAVYTSLTGQYNRSIFNAAPVAPVINATGATGVGVANGGSVQLN